MIARHRAFGLDIEASFPLAGLPPSADPRAPAVAVKLARPEEIDAAWSGPAAVGRVQETVIDSAPYRAELGAGGDLLFAWGAARFHLSGDAAVLLCAPPDAAEPGWRRLLLDTILAAVSMRRGFELVHAGAVLTSGRLVAIVAGTGGGKSTLVAELLRRGGRLFCDDLLTVRSDGGEPICEPGPPLMNLALDGPSAPTGLGRELARFEDEAWVAVERHCSEPQPLATFVLLDRRSDVAAPELVALEMPHLVLMAAALDSGSTAERRELRFRVMSDLAATTSGVRLSAPLDAAPADLAALAERAVDPDAAGVDR